MEKDAKKNETDAENIKEWLLSFERLVGKKTILSLMIDKGEISFYSCYAKKHFDSDSSGEDDDESPEVSLEKQKQEIQTASHLIKAYIG